ncbi:MAG: thioredoxin domain-containing protein [Chitinophagaceae bacterium]
MLKPKVNSTDHHTGNTDALVTLVEFGDFECPHCGAAHPLIQRLLKELGDELHFVFRNFPLKESHPHAYGAAMAAEAAGKQGKFWEMHDLLFENQGMLSEKLFISLASNLGLDKVTFLKDCKSEALAAIIESDFESGIRSGVNGTPGFFVNGVHVLNYDGTYQSLLDAVK